MWCAWRWPLLHPSPACLPALAASSSCVQVSLRIWLLVAYLSVLHIAVMVSFTRNTPDVSALCNEQMAKAMADHKVLPSL